MSLQELGALLLFATAMAFTPGPNTTLSAALAANHGLRHAMPFVWGVPVGWGLLLLACSLGLGALVQAQPVLRGALKWLGLAYMVWLAWQLAQTTRMAQADPKRLQVGFGKGVLLQFVNIKAWMNALVISATWVTVESGALVQRLALVLPLMMFYGVASNFTYAWVGAALRQWLAKDQRLVWFNRSMAALLLLTAGGMTRL